MHRPLTLSRPWGGDLGPFILALEKRLKAGIFTGSGFLPFEIIRDVPEADQINFAPRVTVPVLMLNGRYDTLKPVMSAQMRALFVTAATAGLACGSTLNKWMRPESRNAI